MADVQIESDVREVLSRATPLGNAIKLSEDRLDRKLYERVNKALTNAGGKWDRSAGAHLFPSDAAPKLAAMLSAGVSVDEKRRDQAFFTPPDLARDVVEIADVRGCDVLEPEAGEGALVAACLSAGAARVYCIEQVSEYASRIPNDSKTIIEVADFLGLQRGDLHGGQPFFRIVMNPPFTKNQDIAHVNHALKWLAPGGILVSLMMPNQSRKGFQELIDKYEPEIIEVERGAFKKSGTDIATIIVKIRL